MEIQMLTKRTSLIATVSALIGVAACGKSGKSMDDGLKQDLAAVGGNGVELAPRMGKSQVVVSAIEAGPTSEPTRAPRAVRKPATKTIPSPSARVATETHTAPAPAPAQVIEQRAPTASPHATEPAPLPAMARQPAQRQSGTYKSEAEVFRQMPWIKP
jgi:hypothetical protein